LGCYFVYTSLRVIESLAISTEEVQSKRLTQAVQTALDQHEKGKLPGLSLRFIGKQPPFKFNAATEQDIQMHVELVQGDIARKTELWFQAPKAFEFPGRTAIPFDDDNLQIRVLAKSDMKKGLIWTPQIRVKSPPAKGAFMFSYGLLCEGFTSVVSPTLR
jgi:hypothetical protein